MREILNMTVEQAMSMLAQKNIPVCVEMEHDNTVKGLTIGNPFDDHFEATVLNGIITRVNLFTWKSIIC